MEIDTDNIRTHMHTIPVTIKLGNVDTIILPVLCHIAKPFTFVIHVCLFSNLMATLYLSHSVCVYTYAYIYTPVNPCICIIKCV